MRIPALLLAAVLVLGSTAAAHALDERFAPGANDADAAFRSGDLEGAVETLRQTLAAAEAILGPGHADVADLSSRLALLELYRNQIDRAAELALRALAIRQTLYGELHPDVSASLVDLASIRLVQGRNREAGELYERNVDLWTRLAGPDDPRTRQARANLADFYEASGRTTDAQTLREQPAGSPRGGLAVPAAGCPVAIGSLTPPPWNAALADAIFRVALEHEERIAHALVRSVHHFSGPPSRAEFDRVFTVDGAGALDVARRLHRAVETRDPGVRTLLALSYAARERLLVAALERAAASLEGGAPDYVALVADVRRRMVVGITRFELMRTPGWNAWIDDAGALLARRSDAAKLLRPIGLDVSNEIKYRPEFLACVAVVRPIEGIDYEGLRAAVEIVARNAAALDAFYRFAGIDLDAVLKAYARAQPSGRKGVEPAGDGVMLDRYNKVAYVEEHPMRLAIHLDVSSRDRAADLAALVSQWEHGGFPGVTRASFETLLSTARRTVDPGALADLLDATLLDLRTRYPVEDAASWSSPRVSRWERSRVGREQHHTYYELQFDTHGSYAVPATDFYVTKRLTSPVGMLLAVGLQARDLPKRALDAFARTPPILHVAVLPDPGLEFEVFAHPKSLTRKPGVTAIAAGETPLSPAPPSGWEVHDFGKTGAIVPAGDAANGAPADHVLLDVRPVPGVAPGEAKSFGFHACLLTPLEVRSEGRTVRFASPVWRTRTDVPSTARFVVYRRELGRNWVRVGNEPLALDAPPGEAAAGASPLVASSRDGFLELEMTDVDAPAGRDYEYRVLHRCALKPHADEKPGTPAQTAHGGAAFEIVEVQRSPENSLRCNVQDGYAGIARPWVKVRYRVRGDFGGSPWRDRISVLDPDGQDLARRNAVVTTRDSLPDGASASGSEHSLVTSIAACTEGPYQFRIRLEADGVSEEVAETLYVHVTRDR